MNKKFPDLNTQFEDLRKYQDDLHEKIQLQKEQAHFRAKTYVQRKLK